MRVLVTGGAGFIGSHLVDRLLDDGHHVVVLDDLSTGTRGNLPFGHGRLDLQVGDVADEDAVRRAMLGCDTVVHLAAVASVEASVRDPIRTHRSNLLGSMRVFLEAAAEPGRRVLYASSAAVYGDAHDLPIGEATVPRPLSPYAIDKLAGEHYLAHLHRTGRVVGTAFRFFNVYGPRQDPSSPYSGVIGIFLDRAARGEAVTVYGDGRQTRDFVYVADVVDALAAALGGAAAGVQARPEHPGELPVFNVARGQAVSLLDVLDAVAGLTNVPGVTRIEHAAAREGDVRHSLADITRLRAALGWSPRTPLVEGLAATARAIALP